MAKSVFCGVCEHSADVFHFGAICCEACAAFFRRLVSQSKTPTAICSGNCDLSNKIIRKLCSSCRYQKCLQIGMRESLVKSKKQKVLSSEKTILGKLNEAYQNLLDLRKETFRNQEAKLTYFEEMDDVCSVDLNLVVETLVRTFYKIAPMEDDQQRLLVKNFLVEFMLMDMSFRSIDSNVIILANGNYVDVKNLDEHFQSTKVVTDDSKAAEAKLYLKPYWEMAESQLVGRFQELRIDRNEHLLLCALLYWDFGLENQSEESLEICLKMRSRIFKELSNYERKQSSTEKQFSRTGDLILILRIIDKQMVSMYEYKTISIIYDLCAKNCPLFRI